LGCLLFQTLEVDLVQIIIKEEILVLGRMVIKEQKISSDKSCNREGRIKMEFRKAVEEDIKDIMNIITQAQAYFKEMGINQWQNNYPNVEVISNDIANKNSYVFIKDNRIVATAMISFDGEKTYDSIYQGKWISNEEYAVIHRIAVDNSYKGLGISSEIIENVEQLCLNKGVYSIKIDTHDENISMQRLLEKNKFQYCGIIYLKDGSKRIAFEKTLY
jgi:RimJ/RimL family protein N-acetyltransferase